MNFKTSLQLFFIASILSFVGCTSETISDPDLCDGTLVLSLQETTDTECGTSQGAALVVASGGTGPYTYTLNNNTNDTGSFDNLAAGNYTIEASDANNCTTTIDIAINNIDGINIEVAVTNTECGDTGGAINISASGGVTPYSFSIGNGTGQSEAAFNNLSPGEYNVIAQDANGCEIVETVRVLSDATFGEVKSIITTNCAISGCHDGSRSPNLTSDSGIQNSAERIKSRTGARSMPPSSSGRSLSSAEIELIACWVDDGASLN